VCVCIYIYIYIYTHICVQNYYIYIYIYICVCVCVCVYVCVHTCIRTYIQGGAEPTDTFQMVIDNIWKEEKISETVYKYVQVCYLLLTDYKLIF